MVKSVCQVVVFELFFGKLTCVGASHSLSAHRIHGYYQDLALLFASHEMSYRYIIAGIGTGLLQ